MDIKNQVWRIQVHATAIQACVHHDLQSSSLLHVSAELGNS